MKTALASGPGRARPFSIKTQPGFTAMAVTCFFLLYAPLLPLVVYSFNSGDSLAYFEGLSWRWYVSAWDRPSGVRSRMISMKSMATSFRARLTSSGTGLEGSWRS